MSLLSRDYAVALDPVLKNFEVSLSFSLSGTLCRTLEQSISLSERVPGGTIFGSAGPYAMKRTTEERFFFNDLPAHGLLFFNVAFFVVFWVFFFLNLRRNVTPPHSLLVVLWPHPAVGGNQCCLSLAPPS